MSDLSKSSYILTARGAYRSTLDLCNHHICSRRIYGALSTRIDPHEKYNLGLYLIIKKDL